MPVKLTDLHSLPICPSSTALRSLPPSQQTAVLDRICSALLYALSLSDESLYKFSCNGFVASYARQEATRVLNEIVFPSEDLEGQRRPPQEKVIRKRVLSLALRLAGFGKTAGLSWQIILDICVVYGPKNASTVKEIIEKAIKTNPALLTEIEHGAIPSFASILLSPDCGLHALRKASFCLRCLLQFSPSPVLDQFLKDDEFILALAKCYDTRLAAIASGYGGITMDRTDDTETATLWVGCKVSLIDSFHILLEHVLKGVRDDPRTKAERAFGLVFSLLNLPTASSQPSSLQVPFLNRSMVADYQDAYDLSATLASVLANSDDPRLDLLDATLKPFDCDARPGDKAGALKILLRSSGAPQSIVNSGTGAKGKARAMPEDEPETDVDLDAAVSSVLDVFPDQEPAYVRSLLALPQYGGNAERVVAALLEGDAPPPSVLKSQAATIAAPAPQIPLPERRNVFNNQPIDAINVQIGKRHGDADTELQDRAFLDQMKADILRRAAELSDSDEEKEVDEVDDADDLDSTLDDGVKLVADREDIEGESGEEDDGDHGRLPTPPDTPETICEVTYLKDPNIFNRDATMRRSKAREDLRAQTGWSDEQLEGWRIMLERNPKKDKILQKHEFSGNIKGLLVKPMVGSSRGRGRGGGRGGPVRGRGRGRGGGGEENSEARERAWKDKNKARQANHNRKRGHDRKMARGGAIPGPSS